VCYDAYKMRHIPCPLQVASRHPHLTAIGFDLPRVGPIFTDYVQQAGLGSRARFQEGDFFRDPLPSADVIVFGHVLHDWNLNTKIALLKKAYAALPVVRHYMLTVLALHFDQPWCTYA
jgi:hypothetical protein